MKRWRDRLVVILLGAVAGSALAFNLDSQGRVHRLAAYKGKWVLENCWASWCPHCLEEIPELDALQEDPKLNLRVIGIAVDYPRQVLEFAGQMMVSEPIILGSHALANQIGPVRGLPLTSVRPARSSAGRSPGAPHEGRRRAFHS